jgi:hypothetical protein
LPNRRFFVDGLSVSGALSCANNYETINFLLPLSLTIYQEHQAITVLVRPGNSYENILQAYVYSHDILKIFLLIYKAFLPLLNKFILHSE